MTNLFVFNISFFSIPYGFRFSLGWKIHPVDPWENEKMMSWRLILADRGEWSARVVGTVQTRYRMQLKELAGFLVSRSLILPSAPPWRGGGVIQRFDWPVRLVVKYPDSKTRGRGYYLFPPRPNICVMEHGRICSVSECNLSIYKTYLSMYTSCLVTIVQGLFSLGSDVEVVPRYLFIY